MGFPERAAAGAAFLDREVPGWFDRIDLDRLNMADGDNCILGQLDGPYRKALARRPYVAVDPTAAGFYVAMASPDDWFALTEAWSREIIERRLNVAFGQEMTAWRRERRDLAGDATDARG